MRSRKKRSLLLAFPLLFLVPLFYFPDALGMEKDVGPYRPSAFMVIQAKSAHEIVASKKPFRLTKETEILDAKGTPIKLQMLPVPCKAQIDYEPSADGHPIALKIIVKEVFPGATLNWTKPSPE